MRKFHKVTAMMLIATLVFSGCSKKNENQTNGNQVTSQPENGEDTAKDGLTTGEYTGVGKGNNGSIQVKVVVKEGTLSSIEVVEHAETQGICEPAIERIPEQIVKNQSVLVDVVTGATNTCNGIIEAVKDCIVQAGGDVAKFEVEVEKDASTGKTIEETADVVVIGGGGAGLQAALRAIANGASVTLIEKNAALGGATIMNGSNIVATGSELAKEIFGDNGDTVESFYEDVNKGSKFTIKEELTSVMANKIGEAIDWVSAAAELKYRKAQTQVADHSVNRQVELDSSSSKELIETVSKKFESLGGKIMLDTCAKELVVTDGAVTGVVANDAEGNTIRFTTKSVIIATGGYGADEQYRTEDMAGYLYYGPSFSTGDGLEMAMEIGADADNLDWFKIYPHGWEIEPGIGKLTTYSSKKATDLGGIYVNSKGERILDESSVYSDFRDKIMEQEDSVAYLVMDQETWDAFYELLLLHGFTEELVQGYLANNGSKTPIVVSNGSLEEAAKAAGIDATALAKTVEDYNTFCQNGKDEQFGKPVEFLNSIEGGNYYIVEQKVRFATSLGGLIVNPETMAVLSKEGTEIKNLYAAGEVIGGANGHDSLPSCMNSWSLVSAYLAGQAAFDNISK